MASRVFCSSCFCSVNRATTSSGPTRPLAASAVLTRQSVQNLKRKLVDIPAMLLKNAVFRPSSNPPTLSSNRCGSKSSNPTTIPTNVPRMPSDARSAGARAVRAGRSPLRCQRHDAKNSTDTSNRKNAVSTFIVEVCSEVGESWLRTGGIPARVRRKPNTRAGTWRVGGERPRMGRYTTRSLWPSPSGSVKLTSGDVLCGRPCRFGRSAIFPQTDARSRRFCGAPRASAGPVGGRGGGAPRQSANVLHRVGWLTTSNGRKPALGGAAETASQSTVRSSVHRAVAGKLSGLSVASLQRTARATGDPVTSLAIAALSADRRFSPYPYPSGTRDRRSEAILAPVDYPKCLRAGPKRPLSRSRGQIRSRCLLTGP